MARLLGYAAIALLVLILAVTGLVYALAPHPPEMPNGLADAAQRDAYFESLTETGNPPALSALVIRDDEIVYNAAFGVANPQTGARAAPDTVYHWWSMTKVLTAVAIMQLNEQGALDIDDPVDRYLPYFDVNFEGSKRTDVTIQQLLDHSSGLPDIVPAIIGWVHSDDSLIDQTALLKSKLPEYNTLAFAPGTSAAYSNLGYMTLGAVIEAVAERPYETYVEQEILEPLGMRTTGFVYDGEMAAVEAVGSHPLVSIYTPFLPFLLDLDALISERDGNKWWLNRVYIDATPPTGLIGSTQDAALFMRAYLAAGDGKEGGLLSPQSVEDMMPGPDGVDRRALGWAEFATGERPHVQHIGNGPGYAAIMRLYPDENLGLVVLANGTSLDVGRIVDAMAEMNWQ